MPLLRLSPLALVLALVAAPVAAAPEADEVWSSIVVASDRRPEELVRTLLDLGLPEQDFDLLDRIEAAAAEGVVDADAVAEAAGLIGDVDRAEIVRLTLTAYAEARAYGAPMTVDARVLPPGVFPDPGLGDDDMAPHVGGVCLACPGYDVPVPPGCLTPGPVAATVSGFVAPGGTDCTIYCFNVTPGAQYEFSTCDPDTTLDSIIEVINPADCMAPPLGTSDDVGNMACPIRPASSTVKLCIPPGIMQVHVRVKASVGSGTFDLSYRQTAAACPCAEDCANPNNAVAFVPTTSCQYVTSTLPANAVDGSICSRFFKFTLTAGKCYTFSFCTNACAGVAPNNVVLPAGNLDLQLYGPGCGPVAFNDLTCGLGPQITYQAPTTGTYVLEVRRVAAPVGATFRFYYRECTRPVNQPCAACQSPKYGPFTPTPACQTHVGTIDTCGQDAFYTFMLEAGCQYTFSTCSTAACPGASLTSSTAVEFWDACVPPVGAASTCNGGTVGILGSTLVLNPMVTGPHVLRVRGTNGNFASAYNYTLSYTTPCISACTAPSGLSLAPPSGAADINCSRNETFTVNAAAGTGPVTYNWVISPPAGGSAMPANGVVVSPAMGAGPVQFNTTLHGGCGGGTFNITVNASNACGMTSQQFAYTLTDALPPAIVVPPAAVVSCDAVPGPGNPTASDNCDPNPLITYEGETEMAGACPDQRILTRTWTARDCAGNQTQGSQVITVVDTQAPTLNGVPADEEVECGQPMPPPAMVTATDNCAPSPTVVFVESPAVPGACPGESTIVRTWTATDRCGNSSMASQTISVVDTTPPTLTGDAGMIACIWAPNHDYVCIPQDTILEQLDVVDGCNAGPVTLAIVAVASDQPDDSTGDGHTTMDVAPVGPDGMMCLRAERLGSIEQGRRYYVMAIATDACGNSTDPISVGYVTVNHDSRLRGNRNCIRSTPPRHSRGRGNNPDITPGF